MVQNILGNGIDIPLLGLREASREVEGDLHELFTDECYKIFNCFLLSTSQVNFFLTLYKSLNVRLHRNAQNKREIKFIAQNPFLHLLSNFIAHTQFIFNCTRVN
jgi:hypothetical protein